VLPTPCHLLRTGDAGLHLLEPFPAMFLLYASRTLPYDKTCTPEAPFLTASAQSSFSLSFSKLSTAPVTLSTRTQQPKTIPKLCGSPHTAAVFAQVRGFDLPNLTSVTGTKEATTRHHPPAKRCPHPLWKQTFETLRDWRGLRSCASSTAQSLFSHSSRFSHSRY